MNSPELVAARVAHASRRGDQLRHALRQSAMIVTTDVSGSLLVACGASVPPERVERHAARARLAGLLDQARGGGSGVLVVRGDDGIGKTTLLGTIAGDATDIRVLSIAGTASEAELAFAGLHQLCLPVLDVLDELPEHQRTVLSAALAIGPPASGADRFTIGVATLAVLTTVAAERPLLLAIDDAHLLDAATADALAFACRRLRTEGVAVVVATAGDSDAFSCFESIELPGMEVAEATALLHAACPRVAPPVVEALVGATGGNPLDLLQVAAQLDDAQLAGRLPLPDPLPVGPRLAQAFEDAVTALSAPARAVVEAIAVSSWDALPPIVELCESLGLDVSALDEAEGHGVVVVRGGTVRFCHPLARAAVYRGIPTAARRRLHRAAADVAALDRRDERRALHLSAATVGADEELARLLESIADDQHRRGALMTAADTIERAAKLTPEATERGRRLLLAAETAALCGHTERQLELVGDALPLVDAEHRAALQHCRARGLAATGRGADAQRLLVEEAAMAREPRRHAAMLVDASVIALERRAVDDAIELAARAAEIAGGDRVAGVRARLARGAAMALAGQTEAARGLLGCIDELLAVEGAAAADFLCQGVALPLTWIEEYEAASSVVQRVIVAARARSALGVLPRALVIHSIIEYRTNGWLAAVAAAEEAAALAEDTGQRAVLLAALASLASVEASLGREEACRRHVARARELLGGRTGGITGLGLVSALGSLELGLGRPREAVQAYEPVGDAGRADLPGNPGALMFEADRIEALIEAGRRDEAGAALDQLEGRARAAGNRRSLSALARCRGLLEVDDPDRWFAEAVATAAADGIRYSEARAELRWGEWLGRVGCTHDAVLHLQRARSMLGELGAALWARRADRAIELLGGGGEPARAGATTGAPAAISMLGTFEVRRGDEVVTPPLASVSARAVQVVALAEGTLHVDELVELLWPDAAPGQGRSRLRNVLSRLRASSGDLLERHGDVIRLVEGVTVDVAAFRSHARRALRGEDRSDALDVAHAALSLYRGDLLPGSLYEAWAASPRERLRRDRLALLDLVAASRAEGDDVDVDAAIDALEQAIDAEPYDESRHVVLGRLLLRRGRRSAAASVVKRARRALADLGLPASSSLRSLEDDVVS